MGNIEDLNIDDNLLNIIEDLVRMVNEDPDGFLKTYPNIPFNYYYTIEELSNTKSIVNKEVCMKAKLISSKYHKSIK